MATDTGLHGSAFAAILADGSVVTWGDADDGGDSSAVQDQLQECAADPSLFTALVLPFLVMDPS